MTDPSPEQAAYAEFRAIMINGPRHYATKRGARVATLIDSLPLVCSTDARVLALEILQEVLLDIQETRDPRLRRLRAGAFEDALASIEAVRKRLTGECRN